ncbi:MAG TPA: GatB/YqeY domain-containing protein [Chloroflexota bacterium]|nr:GatB/YqeY domain-containing protein [Chloroflexota bacterium]
MGLKERLEADQREALRSGQTLRLNTIRLLRSALRNEEIAQGRPLTDQEVVELVLARQIRQRREAIAEFQKAGRQDLVDREEAELQVLLGYLPEQLSEAELEVLARAAIAEVGAQSPRDHGKVMARLVPQVRGKADLGAVSQLVQRLLTS